MTLEYLQKHGKRLPGNVLAEGEVTGHTHALETMEGVERYECDGREYLVVTAEGGVKIDHQEHGVGVIEPGVFEKRIDREYDYLNDMTRKVAD